MKGNSRWWTVGLLVILVVLPMAPGPAGGGETRVVTFATTAGGSAGFLTDAIRQQRLDERHGLLLDLKAFDPAKAEEGVYYRRVDAGIFPFVTAARVNLRGTALRIFYPLLWNHNSLLVRREAPFQKLEELKGKRLAMLARITAQYPSVAVIGRILGMDVERDFQLIFGTPPSLIAFLQKREVDAIVQLEPLVSKMVAAGWARELLRFNDLWKEQNGGMMFFIGLAAHKEWIDANRDTARRLARTMRDGIAYVRAQPEETIRRGMTALGFTKDEEVALFRARLPQIYPDRWGEAAIAQANALIRRNVEHGLLERMPPEEIFLRLD
ncbi:MAG: ABC transporter substrate-binding protein [Deltaproteobacteria bacterium]|nr:ABC transporter substrate-binding protein [Deltaproteobacteria bacterium]